MAKKKKNKKKRQQQRTVNPAPLPGPTVSPAAPAGRARQRRRGRAGRANRIDTVWFTIFSQTLKWQRATNALFDRILHPSAFPATPYFNGNADFAERVEHRVEFDILVTAGTLVGYRFGVALDRSLSSPRVVGRDLLLNLIANGLGAMVATTGVSESRASFGVTGPTRVLSNSPPPTLDLVGFAQGRVIIGLIDAPTLAEPTDVEVTVTVTVLMRVSFTPMVPSPGTIAAFVQPIPGPTPQPIPPDEQPTIRATFANPEHLVPGVWHTQDIYLSAGTYWRVDEAADNMPAQHGHSVSAQSWDGGKRPVPNCVYMVVGPGQLPVWPTDGDWGAKGFVPKYFTCYLSGAGGWMGLVGFADLYTAVLQSIYPTSVPPHTECQLGHAWGTSGSEGGKPSAGTAFGSSSIMLREVFGPDSTGGLSGALPALHSDLSGGERARGTSAYDDLTNSLGQLVVSGLQSANALTTWLF